MSAHSPEDLDELLDQREGVPLVAAGVHVPKEGRQELLHG